MIFLLHNFCVKTGSMYFPVFLNTCLILGFSFPVSGFVQICFFQLFQMHRACPSPSRILLQLALVYVYVPEQLSLVDSLPQNAGMNSCTFISHIPIYNIQKTVHLPRVADQDRTPTGPTGISGPNKTGNRFLLWTGGLETAYMRM